MPVRSKTTRQQMTAAQANALPPSQVVDRYWIEAFAPGVDPHPRAMEKYRAYLEDPDSVRTGKWMVFVPSEDHDPVWAKVKAAVEAGQLGPRAKTATAKPSPRSDRPDRWVIVIYTTDFQDRADVGRVLAGLRQLGIGGRISYKRDVETLQSRYGPGASLYVSQPGSLEFDDHQPTRKVHR